MITQVVGSYRLSRTAVFRAFALVLTIAILCTGTAFAASPSGLYHVDIYDGSEITRVSTLKTDAEAIIKQADIELGENDRLSLNEFAAGQDSVIVIYRSSEITFTGVDGKTKTLSFAGRVSDLLASEGITLNNEMVLNLNPNEILKDGMNVSVKYAANVTVTADGEQKAVSMGDGTVRDALEKAGVTLGENDETEPSPDTAVTDGMQITVYRVEYKTRTEEKTVAFDKKSVNSDDMYKGESKVTQKGENGSKNVTYKDKIVDGKVVSSEVIKEEELKKPVTQITAVGTKVQPATTAAAKQTSASPVRTNGSAISELTPPSSLKLVNGVPSSYKSIVRGKAAAYSAPKGSGTASGRKVKPGYIAVNPKQFPYGTELYIVSTDGRVYGYCIAADTGGFVNKGKFTVDLFMNTTSECYSWGARDVIIYVL